MTPFHRSISNSVFPHPNPPDSSGGRAYTFNKLNGSLDVSGGLTFYTIGTHCWLDWNWQCTSSVQLIWEFTVYQNSTFNQAQRETAIKRRQNISVPDPLPPLSLSPRCRLTFLVHFSFVFFLLWSNGKEWCHIWRPTQLRFATKPSYSHIFARCRRLKELWPSTATRLFIRRMAGFDKGDPLPFVGGGGGGRQCEPLCFLCLHLREQLKAINP